jgi:hypothetical protein
MSAIDCIMCWKGHKRKQSWQIVWYYLSIYLERLRGITKCYETGWNLEPLEFYILRLATAPQTFSLWLKRKIVTC